MKRSEMSPIVKTVDLVETKIYVEGLFQVTDSTHHGQIAEKGVRLDDSKLVGPGIFADPGHMGRVHTHDLFYAVIPQHLGLSRRNREGLLDQHLNIVVLHEDRELQQAFGVRLIHARRLVKDLMATTSQGYFQSSHSSMSVSKWAGC